MANFVFFFITTTIIVISFNIFPWKLDLRYLNVPGKDFYVVFPIVSVMCIAYYFSTRTLNYWKRRHVLGPAPIPFFGNFIDVAFRRIAMGQKYKEIYDQYPNEKMIGFYRMTAPTLLIKDLDIVKQLLIKDFDSCPYRGIDFCNEKLGDNIFHANVKPWKFIRGQLTSQFTISKIKSKLHLLIEQSEKLMKYIEDATIETTELDVYKLFLKYTVSTVTIALFEIGFDTFNENTDLFYEIDETLFELNYYNELDLLVPGILQTLKLSMWSDRVIGFCRQLFDIGVNQGTTNDKNVNSVMGVLKKLRNESELYNTKNKKDAENVQVTDNFLIGQIFTFYLAGYGNNTLLLSYTMYYLAEYPEVQDKLVAEVDEILETNNGVLKYESLMEMKYMQMVFLEVLRLHPLTPALSRFAVKDIPIEGSDLVIPKGVVSLISPYAIQRDEKYYPEPEKFDPKRFTPENMKERHPFAYLSFGNGPRSCIGTKFARLQYGVCLATLLSKYRIETSKNTVLNIDDYHPMRILLTPNKSLNLNFVRRKDKPVF